LRATLIAEAVAEAGAALPGAPAPVVAPLARLRYLGCVSDPTGFRSCLPRVRIGVSSCLLGEEVRFDGGHKRDRLLLEALGPLVEWVPVCPEVELGLGVPRPSLRLERASPAAGLRLVVSRDHSDRTAAMERFARRRARSLAPEGLSGYVFKRDSPSCGVRSVRVYGPNGAPARSGTGLWARAVVERFPHLPVEDEGRLRDPRLRESFLAHVLAFRRWQELEEQGLSVRGLMRFHQLHELTLMARSREGARRLYRLVGSAGRGTSARSLGGAYLEELSRVMRRTPTVRSHGNVLRRLAGQVSTGLDVTDRRELAETIDRYRLRLAPLIVAVTLIRHHARRQEQTCLAEQVSLYAQPHELMLLNRL
jgi:uncharacterized protein YbbK (DUF523 family)/uncharacterized protein YbgA (DUF1722 family)